MTDTTLELYSYSESKGIISLFSAYSTNFEIFLLRSYTLFILCGMRLFGFAQDEKITIWFTIVIKNDNEVK